MPEIPEKIELTHHHNEEFGVKAIATVFGSPDEIAYFITDSKTRSMWDINLSSVNETGKDQLSISYSKIENGSVQSSLDQVKFTYTETFLNG